MPRLVLDDTLPDKLRTVAETVEVCERSGRVIGRFVPAVDKSKIDPVGPRVSEEELARRATSSEPRYSTAEVLAHLQRLR